MTWATPAVQAVDAVVLAGGHGTRFGGDKVRARVAGTRLVDRVVQALAPLGGQVIVAIGDRPLATRGAIEVRDDPPGMGPLGGVAAGLGAATTPWVAVVAGDLLAPSPTLLRALAAHAAAIGAAGAMPTVDGRAQPLHGVVRRDAARDAVSTALRGGERRVLEVFEAMGVEPVDEAAWRQWAASARPARDVDRVEDLPGG